MDKTANLRTTAAMLSSAPRLTRRLLELVIISAGWFLESLLTQTFVIHLLRTERIPFIQSWAALPVLASTFGAMAIGYTIPYIDGFGRNGFLRMAAVPPIWYAMLAAILAAYCFVVQCTKILYKRWSESWL